ncbi:hypothetical protein NDI56_02970 [Haloarcula sp. S1CR25-12]|uniref:Uncharacterized protein n=1 Tax=Haloarcula saliterrae TaxID=2950534 RepID=A0ABU2F954_9EURY|nr:hypothetical protein [Haloarcula sp. S1CR25-12]MDS0258370.1 hypothetical protein [Haloarcula sp. S1CR25-12]
MMPPLRRRCPRCGHRDWTTRFPVDTDEGERRVTCPACGHRFEPAERPWLL